MARLAFIYDGHGANWAAHGGFEARSLCDSPPGLSGTELPMFGMALELGKMGHEVSIYSRFKERHQHPFIDIRPGANRGRVVGLINYLDLDDEKPECDIAVAFHDGRPLDGWPAKKKVLYLQTFLTPNRSQDATYTNADFADLYITATEHCARHLRAAYGWPDVRVVPNGWDLGQYHPWDPIPGRLIYTTSLERGFHRLTEVLPLIRQRVPEAHVVVFERGGPAIEKLKANPVDGVTLVKASSRNAVLKELSRAACFAYPIDCSCPTEVFPLSVTEALATGVPVVMAPEDGMEKLFEGAAWFTPPIKEYSNHSRDAFVDATCEMLTNQTVAREWSEKGKAWAAPLRFAHTARIFCESLGLP